MKTLFTSSLLALSVSASAQFTLNLGSYTSWQPKTENMRDLDTTGMMGFPVLTPATNAVWNLSNYMYGGYYFTERAAGMNAAFPTATFYDTSTYTISGPLRYGVHQHGAKTANGFEYYGQSMTRQAFNIAAVSGGANDSLIFPTQTVAYSSPMVQIKFPAMISSMWTSNYNFTTDFYLTVAAYSLNNAPCQRQTMLMQRDSVVGWGTMQVRDSAGTGTTSTMDVMMVRHHAYQVDSFFLNGNPAPPQLLGAFGLTQGMVTEKFHNYFYRPGELMPLVQALYADNTYSAGSTTEVLVHMNRLAATQGVVNIADGNSVTAYPNPVRNNSVSVQVTDKNVSSLNYTLLNMSGQVVSQGRLNTQSGTAQLTAEALATPGIYYLQLFKETAPYATLPLSVQ